MAEAKINYTAEDINKLLADIQKQSNAISTHGGSKTPARAN